MKPVIPRITHEHLLEKVSYEPLTGIFTNKALRRGSAVRIGDVLGRADRLGYYRLYFHPELILAHRVAWFYVHGKWPVGSIDHINGVAGDNRIANLRDVSHAVNLQNIRKANRNNKLGLLGVHRADGGFVANIMVNRKCIHIGKFDTPEAAHLAYVESKRRLHPGGML